MGRDVWSSTTRGTRLSTHFSLRTRLLKNLLFIEYVLLYKEFDVVGPPMTMTLGRIRLFDYVGVFEEENSALVTPALTEESSILSTIKPFQPIVRRPTFYFQTNTNILWLFFFAISFLKKVWLMVLISLLSVAIYFSASSTLNLDRSDKNSRSLNFGDYFLYATGILTNQCTLHCIIHCREYLSFFMHYSVSIF